MITRSTDTLSRRTFVARSLSSLLAVASLLTAARSGAAQSEAPKVSEGDPSARALGYVHDVRSADTERFPQMATVPGQAQQCLNCRLYGGPKSETWGPCALFPGKSVSGKGWCAAWTGAT